MLRITSSTSARGATAYFNKELSRGDYYADKGELSGRWYGKAAELLGLTGEVSREQFAALANNHHPETGEQLTPRQRADRRAGYDFTFSAPKSASALYEYLRATGRDEQAGALLDQFTGSVRETMAELEADMRVRVRAKGGQGDRVTGNLIWAEFTHFQSRPVDGFADPHLHTHAYAMNLTHDSKSWKAGEFGSIKRDATYYQEAFHARLGHALQGLGYAVEATDKGFQVKGVERATVEKFSRRTAEVEKATTAKGITYSEDKARLGAATRKSKDEGLPPEETRRVFYGRLSETEKATFERIADGGGLPPSNTTAGAALDYALRHSFERSSTASEKRLLAEALKAGVGSVLPEQLWQAARASRDLLRAEIGGEQVVTTRAVLHEETAMLDFARAGRAQHAPLGSQGVAEGAPYQFRREWLSDEQRAAVRHVLESSDRVIGIRGGAGTGKTAMLQETVEAVAAVSGKQAVILAPSAQASRGVLREEGFTDADTVARFLQDTAMQERAKGGVIVVDEAGLLGSRTMHALFQVAQRQGARVVLQGDTRQHASVERGDALRLLDQRGGVKFAELSTIRRQEPKAYRDAVAALATGDARKGFDALDKMGAILEVRDENRHEQLARAYLDSIAHGETALVVSPTHAEGARVTESIRQGLRERGKLGEERAALQLRPTGWTEAERGNAARYAPGQEVAFHQNAPGFTRGERGTVLAVEDGKVMLWTAQKEIRALPLQQAARFQVFQRGELALAVGDAIRITQNGRDEAGTRLNNGASYRVHGFTPGGGVIVKGEQGSARTLAHDFGHVAHDYATTSHASQGRTVDRVFIAQGAESFSAASREQFYVSASRGRRSVQVFTDDKAELAHAVERSGARAAASDVASRAEREPERAGFYERLKAKAIELVRRSLWERFAHTPEDGERSGLLHGWPQRSPERALGR